MKKRGILFILVIILLIGCIEKEPLVIEANELQELRENQIEEISLSEQQMLDLDFADDLYLKDYSEVLRRLTIESNAYHRELYKEYLDESDILMTELFLYNYILNEAMTNNLSFSDIMNNHPEMVKEIRVYNFRFSDVLDINNFEETELYERSRFSVLKRKLYEEENEIHKLFWMIYTNEYEAIDYDVMSPILLKAELAEKAKGNYYLDLSRESIYYYGCPVDTLSISDDIKELKEKYNEEFFYLYTLDKRKYFAPIDNPELVFEANSIGDRYLTVLAQYKLSKAINEIIDKYGYDDVVYFLFPDYSLEYGLNINDIELDEDVLYKGKQFELSLYLLANDFEKFNHQVFLDVVFELEKVFNEKLDLVFYCFVYELDNDRKPVVKKVFDSNPMTENYVREYGGLTGANYDVVRNDSIMFKVLDYYGIMSNEMYWIHHLHRGDYTIESFKNVYGEESKDYN